jgi:SHS2 domain-containing protein
MQGQPLMEVVPFFVLPQKIRYTGIMMRKIAGYREVEHIADWELHVWAPDLLSLLKTAAQGMYALSDTELAVEPRHTHEFEIAYLDGESLLVDFLSELLFLGEDETLAFDLYQLNLIDNNLQVQAYGAPIQKQSKEIKAVTYHGLRIRETERGLEVNIVFDV